MIKNGPPGNPPRLPRSAVGASLRPIYKALGDAAQRKRTSRSTAAWPIADPHKLDLESARYSGRVACDCRRRSAGADGTIPVSNDHFGPSCRPFERPRGAFNWRTFDSQEPNSLRASVAIKAHDLRLSQRTTAALHTSRCSTSPTRFTVAIPRSLLRSPLRHRKKIHVRHFARRHS